MGKSPKQQEPEEDEAVIMERMKRGFKQLLNTPPETHEQMVKRQRKQGVIAERKPKRDTHPKKKVIAVTFTRNALGGPPVSYPQPRSFGLDFRSLVNALGDSGEGNRLAPARPRDPNSAYDRYIAPLDSVGSRYDGVMDGLVRWWG